MTSLNLAIPRTRTMPKENEGMESGSPSNPPLKDETAGKSGVRPPLVPASAQLLHAHAVRLLTRRHVATVEPRYATLYDVVKGFEEILERLHARKRELHWFEAAYRQPIDPNRRLSDDDAEGRGFSPYPPETRRKRREPGRALKTLVLLGFGGACHGAA